MGADPLDAVVSVNYVAAVCGIGRTTAQGFCDHGGLTSHRLPSGHRRVKLRDLIDFMQSKGMPLDRLPAGARLIAAGELAVAPK